MVMHFKAGSVLKTVFSGALKDTFISSVITKTNPEDKYGHCEKNANVNFIFFFALKRLLFVDRL